LINEVIEDIDSLDSSNQNITVEQTAETLMLRGL